MQCKAILTAFFRMHTVLVQNASLPLLHSPWLAAPFLHEALCTSITEVKRTTSATLASRGRISTGASLMRRLCYSPATTKQLILRRRAFTTSLMCIFVFGSPVCPPTENSSTSSSYIASSSSPLLQSTFTLNSPTAPGSTAVDVSSTSSFSSAYSSSVISHTPISSNASLPTVSQSSEPSLGLHAGPSHHTSAWNISLSSDPVQPAQTHAASTTTPSSSVSESLMVTIALGAVGCMGLLTLIWWYIRRRLRRVHHGSSYFMTPSVYLQMDGGSSHSLHKVYMARQGV